MTLIDHTTVFMANRDSLLAYIGALVRQPEVTEDIFQDVWISLADACEKGVVIQDTRSWCRGTAKNLILKHWRSQRNARTVADERLLDLAARALEEDEHSESAWTVNGPALIACIQQLSDASRKLLRLRFGEGLSAVEISAQIGQPYEAVRKAIFRIKKNVEDCVHLKIRSRA